MGANLDAKTLALIGVGASVGANCFPCLEQKVTDALKAGASVEEIAQAVQLGEEAKMQPNQGIKALADMLLQNAQSLLNRGSAGGCG